ncbi:MAG TPA: hypothetical protein VGA67_00905 [Candidatus Dojkabacteria bacterium]|jgi:hypothetical protein
MIETQPYIETDKMSNADTKIDLALEMVTRSTQEVVRNLGQTEKASLLVGTWNNIQNIDHQIASNMAVIAKGFFDLKYGPMDVYDIDSGRNDYIEMSAEIGEASGLSGGGDRRRIRYKFSEDEFLTDILKTFKTGRPSQLLYLYWHEIAHHPNTLPFDMSPLRENQGIWGFMTMLREIVADISAGQVGAMMPDYNSSIDRVLDFPNLYTFPKVLANAPENKREELKERFYEIEKYFKIAAINLDIPVSLIYEKIDDILHRTYIARRKLNIFAKSDVRSNVDKSALPLDKSDKDQDNSYIHAADFSDSKKIQSVVREVVSDLLRDRGDKIEEVTKLLDSSREAVDREFDRYLSTKKEKLDLAIRSSLSTLVVFYRAGNDLEETTHKEDTEGVDWDEYIIDDEELGLNPIVIRVVTPYSRQEDRRIYIGTTNLNQYYQSKPNQYQPNKSSDEDPISMISREAIDRIRSIMKKYKRTEKIVDLFKEDGSNIYNYSRKVNAGGINELGIPNPAVQALMAS